MESEKVHLGGVIVRDLSCKVSNYRANLTLDEYLKQQKVGSRAWQQGGRAPQGHAGTAGAGRLGCLFPRAGQPSTARLFQTGACAPNVAPAHMHAACWGTCGAEHPCSGASALLRPLQVMGIAGVDTRAITRRLRVTGCLNGAICTDPSVSGTSCGSWLGCANATGQRCSGRPCADAPAVGTLAAPIGCFTPQHHPHAKRCHPPASTSACADEDLLAMTKSWTIVGKDLIKEVTCKEPYEWTDPTGEEWEFAEQGELAATPLPSAAPCCASWRWAHMQVVMRTSNAHWMLCTCAGRASLLCTACPLVPASSVPGAMHLWPVLHAVPCAHSFECWSAHTALPPAPCLQPRTGMALPLCALWRTTTASSRTSCAASPRSAARCVACRARPWGGLCCASTLLWSRGRLRCCTTRGCKLQYASTAAAVWGDAQRPASWPLLLAPGQNLPTGLPRVSSPAFSLSPS